MERTNYVIAKDEQDRLVEAYGSKYSMGVANYNTKMVVDTFFFKENNHYDGKTSMLSSNLIIIELLMLLKFKIQVSSSL